MLTDLAAAAGTSPGHLVETDSNYSIISEFPEDFASNANILADNVSPHGLTVNFDKNIILTSDFIVPLSILKPSLGKISDNTLRLWDLDTRTIISTLTIPNACRFCKISYYLRGSLLREWTLIAHNVFLGCAVVNQKDDYVIQVAPTVAKTIGFFRPYFHLQQPYDLIT